MKTVMKYNRFQEGLVTNKSSADMRSILFSSMLCCLAFTVEATEEDVLLDKWLNKQAAIKTWTANVVQTRKIKSLVRPLESQGKVWFVQPNQFRWQLGSPPRTIAVRTHQELKIIYPKLKQMERYPFDNITDPAMQQALALLEVGFPTHPEHFRARYELISITTSVGVYKFELQPRDKQARRLLTRVRMDASSKDLSLLATELEFPDGSTMRNAFSNHKLNVKIDEALFRIDATDYQVVQPLGRKD
jgi:outer membrane lipoprotein-sorting protein